MQSLTTAPLALGGTIPKNLYPKVVSGLVANVAAQGNHQTVGSVGAKYLLTQLAGAGQQKTAMLVATQKTYPSFGYWLSQGATTCWENYSGKPDPSHPPTPTHNHIFLCGGLGEWLYRNVAGISPGSNGYQDVTIFPDVVADVGPRRASSSVNTVAGRVEASWQRVPAVVSRSRPAFLLPCSRPPSSFEPLPIPQRKLPRVIRLCGPLLAALPLARCPALSARCGHLSTAVWCRCTLARDRTCYNLRRCTSLRQQARSRRRRRRQIKESAVYNVGHRWVCAAVEKRGENEG